ncbi:DEAD/DEAH box helicase family protein [bacterium]|nr:DEAD/DEAH box helicase family protein [bacterium]
MNEKPENLHVYIKKMVDEWRNIGYPSKYPELATILDYNANNQSSCFNLRKAQCDALETYWYLRIIENTPHIIELYKKLFLKPSVLLESLGVVGEEIKDIIINEGIGEFWNKIKIDDGFVKKYKLKNLRETISLNYPSYIFALAMGVGKTVLIGSIIATEFVMSLQYPEDDLFARNALVFAQGKTIFGALQEIAQMPFSEILPKRFYKKFIANAKFTYTQDGSKDIPVIKGSNHNIIVTNTEKIRLTKKDILKSYLGNKTFAFDESEAKELIANLRLSTITSLPNIAIFADEAHHLYGRYLDSELKRVRQTVNYINQKTDLKVVVNTTGTPYYDRKILKDVVFWYGLSQGIEDGILKEVRNNIESYPEVNDIDFLNDVVIDFLKNYRDVKIFDGSPAKLAIYFPKIEDLEKSKSIIEQIILSEKLDTSMILPVHHNSQDKIQDLFKKRINDSEIKYRIFLLVNIGTEGWNCPSLFATALARELKSSNNFVLQAASRCLRQVPGNTKKAKIYLSKNNISILEKQLQETYGVSLNSLNRLEADKITLNLELRKTEIEPLVLNKTVKRFISKFKDKEPEIILSKPDIHDLDKAEKIIYSLRQSGKGKVLIPIGKGKVQHVEVGIGIRNFAVELGEIYRIDSFKIYKMLERIYLDGEISLAECKALQVQLEKLVSKYDISEETIEESIAIIKKKGFKTGKVNGKDTLYTEIKIKKDRLENYIVKIEDYEKNGQLPLFGFHYSPYNFDSTEEREFFDNLLRELKEKPDDIDDIYFMGAITDRNKTGFVFEVKDETGDWSPYSPDFLIRKKNGKSLIVEIKGKPYYDEKAKNAEKQMLELVNLNKDKIKYELLLFDKNDTVLSKIKLVKDWIYKEGVK